MGIPFVSLLIGAVPGMWSVFNMDLESYLAQIRQWCPFQKQMYLVTYLVNVPLGKRLSATELSACHN